MSKNTSTDTQASTSKRRKIVAGVLVLACALLIGLGAWALQAHSGSAALRTVADQGTPQDDRAKGEDRRSQDATSAKTDASQKNPAKKDESQKKNKDDSPKDAKEKKNPDTEAKKTEAQKTEAQDSQSKDAPAKKQADVAPPEEVILEVSEPAEETTSTPEVAITTSEERPTEEPQAHTTVQPSLSPEPSTPQHEDVQPQDDQPTEPTSVAVVVTIDASPAGGSVHEAQLTLARGSNVYDALMATGASVNARATGYGTYVAAIDGVAEKDHGPMSGWVYAVNGVEPSTACSNYELSDGDTVVWTYVNVES